MTDKNKQSPAAVDEQTANPTAPEVTTDSQSSSKAGVITGAIAILIALGLTGGLFYHGHQQGLEQKQAIAKLQSQLQKQSDSQKSLEIALSESKQTTSSQLQQTSAELQKVQQAEKLATAQLETVQLAVANLKMRNPNEWMLAEAEYLIRMAGRKLILEQDVTGSLALLASASRRITELNDPSLLPLRKIVEEDIAALATLPKVDRDGVALKLSIQAAAVDKLVLNNITRPTVTKTDKALSENAADWQQNLAKSWRSFSENFITVRRQEADVEALLSPNQAWYLTENLKTKLLQAELAVYRQNQPAFNNSLDTAISWINRYFDKGLSNTQAMLTSLQTLRDSVITAKLPAKLNSAKAIQTTIKERKIRTLTADSAQ